MPPDISDPSCEAATNATPPESRHVSRPTARELFLRPGIEVVPGAGSPLEARLIEAAGFDAIYLSGYALAAVQGRPDVGLVGAAEAIANVSAVRDAVDLPLIVDADTGYGDAVNVRDTVRRLERAGASAIQIEDQVWPKRCGHMAGKQVIDRRDMLRKVRAAVDARRDERTVIIARTDARAPLGIDEAIDRAHSFATAGAGAVFVDAPESVEELERIGSEIAVPTMVNMSETGLTPLLPASTLGQLGFSVAIFPTSVVRVGAHAVARFLGHLRRSGASNDWLEAMMSLDELNTLVGLNALADFDSRIAAAIDGTTEAPSVPPAR